MFAGLLYWKQQNLDNNRVDNLREVQNVLLRPCNKLHVCSETNIHSANRSDIDNSIERLNKTIDLCDSQIQEGKDGNGFINFSFLEYSNINNMLLYLPGFSSSSIVFQDIPLNEKNTEPSFLEVLDKLNFKNIKEVSKFKSDKDISEETFEELPKKSGIKFQVDSDDDSSDNCGLRSPLLCRHESLEKENQERKTYTYNNKAGKKISRTFSTEENNDRSFNKMIRTLSVDEDAVLSRKYKTSEVLPKLEGGAFGSVLLSVYDDNMKNFQDEKRRTSHKKDSEAGKDKKSGKPATKRQSSLHSTKKLSLTSPVNRDELKHQDDNKNSKRNEKLTNKDVLSWSNERVGLEWLFEHTDSETDNPNGEQLIFFLILKKLQNSLYEDNFNISFSLPLEIHSVR